MSFKWNIDKEFHFEMGHRVWAQKLEHEHLSLSTECACKHLHGHSYAIKVFLGADKQERQLRNMHSGVKEAYDKYRMMIELTQGEQDEH